MRKTLVLLFLLIFANFVAVLVNPVQAATYSGATRNCSFVYDASGQNHMMSMKGGLYIDPGQQKFSSVSSLSLNGATGYLSTPDSADWYFGTGAFSIDFWVKLYATPSSGSLAAVWSQSIAWNDIVWFALNNVAGTYYWYLQAYPYGIEFYFQTSVSTNTWYHIALVRNGNNWYCFQDGIQKGSTGVDADAWPDIANQVVIGTYDNGAALFLNAWLEEFRVSNVARWTSGFTPPTTEYTTDVNTKLLLHFNDYFIGSYPANTYSNQHGASNTPYIWEYGTPNEIGVTTNASASYCNQRQISALGNTRAFIFQASGNLYVETRQYTGSGATDTIVFASGSWSASKGAIISDFILANPSYAETASPKYCLVAVEMANHTGIQVAVVRVIEANPDSNPTVTVLSTVGRAYSAFTQNRSMIAECQLFQDVGGTGYGYISYSYVTASSGWNMESWRVNNVLSTPTATVCVQAAFGWSVPVAMKYAYSPITDLVYGMLMPVYVNTYDPTYYNNFYDMHALGTPIQLQITARHGKYGCTTGFDPYTNTIWSIFATSVRQCEIFKWYTATATYSETYLNANFPDDSPPQTGDFLQVTACGNKQGQLFINALTLINSIYYRVYYAWSLDMGSTWSGRTIYAGIIYSNWYQSEQGTGAAIMEMLSIPTYFQKYGFATGLFGKGCSLDYVSGTLTMRTFKYVPNIITFTGITTLQTVTSITASSSITQLTTFTQLGTSSKTENFLAYVYTDPTVTIMTYAIAINAVFVGVAVAFGKSLLSMMTGLTLGTTISVALGLIPIWILIAIIIGLILVLLFNRAAGQE